MGWRTLFYTNDIPVKISISISFESNYGDKYNTDYYMFVYRADSGNSAIMRIYLGNDYSKSLAEYEVWQNKVKNGLGFEDLVNLIELGKKDV